MAVFGPQARTEMANSAMERQRPSDSLSDLSHFEMVDETIAYGLNMIAETLVPCYVTAFFLPGKLITFCIHVCAIATIAY